jgi:hypothetical protein
MSQVYQITTVQEQNDKGTWFGWEVARERALDLSAEEDEFIFKQALDFGKSVKAGEVQVKEDKTAGFDKETGEIYEKEIM